MNTRSRTECPSPLLALTLATLLFVGGCASDKDASQYLSEAEAQLESGEVRTAIINLKNVLQSDPRNAQARLLLAKAYLDTLQGELALKELRRAGEYGIADEQFTAAMAEARFLTNDYEKLLAETAAVELTDPRAEAQIYFLRGLAHLNRGQRAQALKSFDRASATGDHQNLMHAGLAAAYALYLREEYDQALATALVLTQKFPKKFEPHEVAGRILALQKKTPEGVSHLEKAIRLAPSRHQLYLYLALAHAAGDDLVAAEQAIDTLLSYAGNYPTALAMKASYRLRQKDWQTAQDVAEKMIANTPSDPQGKLISGIASFYLENFETSRRRLQAVAPGLPEDHIAHKLLAYIHVYEDQERDPEEIARFFDGEKKEDLQALAMLGKTFLDKGDVSGAERLFEQAVERAPQSAALLTHMGTLELMRGDESGVQTLAHALKLDPEDLNARVNLARYHAAQENYEEALQLAEGITSNTVTRHLLKAEIHAARKAYRKADRELEAALALKPSSAELLMARAKLATAQQEWQEAEKFLQETLAVDPEHQLALLNLFRVKQAQGKADEGLAIVAKKQKENPTSDPLKLAYGLLLSNAGRYAEAASLLKTIDENSASYPRSLAILTSAHFRAGDMQQTLQSLSKWSRAQPTNSVPYQALVDLTAHHSGPRAALTVLREHPLFKRAGRWGGLTEIRLLLSTTAVNEGLRKVPEFVKKHGESAGLSILLGRHYAGKGEIQKALPQFQRAFELTPGTSTLSQLVRFHLGQGELDQSIALMRSWLEQHPQDQTIRLLLTDQLLRTGAHHEELVDHYRMMLKQEPENVMVLNNLASTLARQGKWDEAGQYAHTAYQLHPELAAVLATYGEILVQQGQAEQGLELLEQAFEQKPTDPSIAFHYARALHLQGRNNDAIPILEKIAGATFREQANAKALLATLKG